MIKNKNQLKKQLKENKNGIKVRRVYNMDKNNKIPEGTKGKIDKVQSNAFTIAFENGCNPWVYYDNIEVIDNMIQYYGYIPDDKKEEAEKTAEEKGIQLIPVSPDDKINKNSCSNYSYIYKYIIIKNEIIEENI